jgi:hypothetical protein
MTALAAAHILHVGIIMSLAASSAGLGSVSVARGSVAFLMVIIGLALEVVVLVMTTYWRSSWIVRVVELRLVVGVWLLLLVLRSFDLWIFGPYRPDQFGVKADRMAAVALLVVTAPLVVALKVAFWRDRESASPSLAPSTLPSA